MKTTTINVLTGHGFGSAKSKLERLKAAGIPARKVWSPYVGMTGFEVPSRCESRAFRALSVIPL